MFGVSSNSFRPAETAKRRPDGKNPKEGLPDPAPTGPINLGGPLKVVVISAVIFVVAQILASLVLLVVAYTSGRTVGAASNWLANSPAASFWFTLLSEGLLIGLVLLAVRRAKLRLPAVGLNRPRRDFIWRAIIGYLAYVVMIIITFAVVSALIPGFEQAEEQDLLGFEKASGPAALGMVFLALVVLAPIGEEILMRGYLYSGLRARLRYAPAAILTSLLFGFLHLGAVSGEGVLWTAGLATFLLSLVLVHLREKTGNIWAGVIVHALNNLVAFGLRFL